jgi:hypothetical protein
MTSDGEQSHRSPLDAIEAALELLPARQRVQAPRWLVPLAISAIVCMVPWLVYLGLTLPSRVRSENYDIAWLGFDSLLLFVIALLGICAWRRHPAAGLLAAVAAAMLVVDAWFDVTTSSGSGTVVALVLAACGELPLAVICGWAAFAAERHRALSYASMRERWESAVTAAREAALTAASVATAAAEVPAAATVTATSAAPPSQ